MLARLDPLAKQGVMTRSLLLVILAAMSAGCVDKTDADYRAEVVASMHDSIGADLAELVRAARHLQAVSPSRAWDTSPSAPDVMAMRDAWKRTRSAYEHIEGAIVALFPGTDSTMDARYDELLARLAPEGDSDPFDHKGVTGMHAIERILYAPTIRAEVTASERALAGYQPATYPATDDDAIEFKTLLVQRLIDDASGIVQRWQPGVIDVGAAYRGLVGLMNEQQEKISLAARRDEESRYANVTLLDLRNNVEGTQRVYGLFRDWIRSKPGGTSSDAVVMGKLDELAKVYADADSESLPVAPTDWSDAHPTPENLATPFGTLWQTVHQTADVASDGSVVAEMNRIAMMLGLPAFAP